MSVVCPDLRGYGQSSTPEPDAEHHVYSDRAMAGDIASLMQQLGHERFSVGQENYDDMVAAISSPATVRAMLEDYRAGLHVDRGHDEADRDAGRRIACPTLVAWSRDDDMEDLYADPGAIWESWCEQSPRTAVIESGHHMAEENPHQLASVLGSFLLV